MGRQWALFLYAEAKDTLRHSNGSWKTTLGNGGNLAKDRQSDSLKQESTYSFSWGWWRGNCCWWWWWWVRTNEASHRSMQLRFWVLTNLCSELSLNRPTMPAKEGGGGQDSPWSTRTHKKICPSWVSQLWAGYSCAEQDLRNIHEFNIIILWLKRQIKQSFYFPVDTRPISS